LQHLKKEKEKEAPLSPQFGNKTKHPIVVLRRKHPSSTNITSPIKQLHYSKSLYFFSPFSSPKILPIKENL